MKNEEKIELFKRKLIVSSNPKAKSMLENEILKQKSDKNKGDSDYGRNV